MFALLGPGTVRRAMRRRTVWCLTLALPAVADGCRKPAIVFTWLPAPLWREGVAPQGAQNTRRTSKMRALAGAMEGETPSLQSTTHHAPRASSKTGISDWRCLARPDSPVASHPDPLASLWREGVAPSIAPQGAQNTRRTSKMRALAGAMEGETPSLQSTTHHAPRASSKTGISDWRCLARPDSPLASHPDPLASLWMEGVPPSIAPQGAQNTRRTSKMRALAGAMEGETPSLQSTTHHAPRASSKTGISDWRCLARPDSPLASHPDPLASLWMEGVPPSIAPQGAQNTRRTSKMRALAGADGGRDALHPGYGATRCASQSETPPRTGLRRPCSK